MKWANSMLKKPVGHRRNIAKSMTPRILHHMTEFVGSVEGTFISKLDGNTNELQAGSKLGE